MTKQSNVRGKKYKIKYLFILCFSFSLYSQTASAQAVIEVFVDQAINVPTIPNVSVVVFDLSRVAELKKKLPRFPPDQSLAMTEAKSWMASPAGKMYAANLQAAYAGREIMMKYGIQKIPAVAFDRGQFVVYGTTDILQAIADYDHFQRMQKH